MSATCWACMAALVALDIEFKALFTRNIVEVNREAKGVIQPKPHRSVFDCSLVKQVLVQEYPYPCRGYEQTAPPQTPAL